MSSNARRVSSSGVIGSQECTWYRSMQSTCRRRSDASSARCRCRRESPTSFGPSPIGNRPLVASTTASVMSAGRSASQRPMYLLGDPGRIDIGGVHQGAAGLDEGIQLRVRSGLVGFRAECHGAERESGHGAAAAAEGAIFHPPILACRRSPGRPGRDAGAVDAEDDEHGVKVIVFGATGMVGQAMLAQCLADGGIDEVLVVGRSTRRPAGRQAARDPAHRLHRFLRAGS